MRLAYKQTLDPYSYNLNDYVIYYNRVELLDKGKTKLLIDHLLAVLVGFEYSEVMVLFNPDNKYIKDITQIKPDFINNKIIPLIEKSIFEPVEAGTKRKTKLAVEFDGTHIETKRLKLE